jgi:hypothetical protein
MFAIPTSSERAHSLPSLLHTGNDRQQPQVKAADSESNTIGNIRPLANTDFAPNNSEKGKASKTICLFRREQNPNSGVYRASPDQERVQTSQEQAIWEESLAFRFGDEHGGSCPRKGKLQEMNSRCRQGATLK